MMLWQMQHRSLYPPHFHVRASLFAIGFVFALCGFVHPSGAEPHDDSRYETGSTTATPNEEDRLRLELESVVGAIRSRSYLPADESTYRSLLVAAKAIGKRAQTPRLLLDVIHVIYEILDSSEIKDREADRSDLYRRLARMPLTLELWQEILRDHSEDLEKYGVTEMVDTFDRFVDSIDSQGDLLTLAKAVQNASSNKQWKATRLTKVMNRLCETAKDPMKLAIALGLLRHGQIRFTREFKPLLSRGLNRVIELSSTPKSLERFILNLEDPESGFLNPDDIDETKALLQTVTSNAVDKLVGLRAKEADGEEKLFRFVRAKLVPLIVAQYHRSDQALEAAGHLLTRMAEHSNDPDKIMTEFKDIAQTLRLKPAQSYPKRVEEQTAFDQLALARISILDRMEKGILDSVISHQSPDQALDWIERWAKSQARLATNVATRVEKLLRRAGREYASRAIDVMLTGVAYRSVAEEETEPISRILERLIDQQIAAATTLDEAIKVAEQREKVYGPKEGAVPLIAISQKFEELVNNSNVSRFIEWAIQNPFANNPIFSLNGPLRLPSDLIDHLASLDLSPEQRLTLAEHLFNQKSSFHSIWMFLEPVQDRSFVIRILNDSQPLVLSNKAEEIVKAVDESAALVKIGNALQVRGGFELKSDTLDERPENKALQEVAAQAYEKALATGDPAAARAIVDFYTSEEYSLSGIALGADRGAAFHIEPLESHIVTQFYRSRTLAVDWQIRAAMEQIARSPASLIEALEITRLALRVGHTEVATLAIEQALSRGDSVSAFLNIARMAHMLTTEKHHEARLRNSARIQEILRKAIEKATLLARGSEIERVKVTAAQVNVPYRTPEQIHDDRFREADEPELPDYLRGQDLKTGLPTLWRRIRSAEQRELFRETQKAYRRHYELKNAYRANAKALAATYREQDRHIDKLHRLEKDLEQNGLTPQGRTRIKAQIELENKTINRLQELVRNYTIILDNTSFAMSQWAQLFMKALGGGLRVEEIISNAATIQVQHEDQLEALKVARESDTALEQLFASEETAESAELLGKREHDSPATTIQATNAISSEPADVEPASPAPVTSDPVLADCREVLEAIDKAPAPRGRIAATE